MSRPRNTHLIGGSTLLGLAALCAPAIEAANELALDRGRLISGGGAAAGGPFELHGSLAQPEAHAASIGGDFELRGGFWIDSDAPSDPDASIFGDGFEN